MTKKTHEEYIIQLREIDADIAVLERYINTDTKIQVKCLKCGHIWSSTPNNLLSGHGCKYCKRKKGAVNRKKTHSQFIEEMREKNPSIEVLGQYTNSKESITVRCKNCGFYWDGSPYHLLQGHGCRKCGVKKYTDSHRKSQEEFEAELESINADILVRGRYQSNSQYIEVQCKKCMYIWQAIPGNLLKGRGCPRCASYMHTSFPEQAVFYYIKKYYPDAVNGYKDVFLNGMELDIYIPSRRIGIEYDGKAWHSTGKAYKREVSKYAACKSNDIYLIRVKEAQLESDGLTADQIIYTEESLEKTILKLVAVVGIYVDINIDRDKDAIFGQYNKDDVNDVFLRKLEIINPDVIPLSRYTLSSNKMPCRCKKCGYEWETTPNKLLMKRGCPKCAGKMKKSTQQFIEELAMINQNIQVIGEYTNAQAAIDVRCRKCQYEWSPVAGSLLAGNGCPKCSKRLHVTHEQFIEELKAVNADIEVLGTYITKRTPILVKCKKCGREWAATSDSLLRKHGCGQCAGILRKTTKEFAEELSKVNNKFMVVGEYQNARTKIKVVCRVCGFERIAVPYSLLKGLKCPICDK